MGRELLDAYRQEYESLYEMPLYIQDNAAALKFQDLMGTDHHSLNTESTSATSLDLKSSQWKHIHLAAGVKKHQVGMQGRTGMTRAPNLAPMTVLVDLQNKNSTGLPYTIRGFDKTGTPKDITKWNYFIEVIPTPYKPLSPFEVYMKLEAGELATAYYLPWMKNHSKVMQLGASADLFFTSMMSGCTVQFFGDHMAPFVTHTNAGKITEPDEAQEYMNELLDTGAEELSARQNHPSLASNATKLAAPDYRNVAFNYVERKYNSPNYERGSAGHDMQTIVVGFRDRLSHNWAFYSQEWVRLNLQRRATASPHLPAEKRILAIKRVRSLWPYPQVLVNSWKQRDE